MQTPETHSTSRPQGYSAKIKSIKQTASALYLGINCPPAPQLHSCPSILHFYIIVLRLTLLLLLGSNTGLRAAHLSTLSHHSHCHIFLLVCDNLRGKEDPHAEIAIVRSGVVANERGHVGFSMEWRIRFDGDWVSLCISGRDERSAVR